ncbi:MAG TPA: DNA mismatch repair protein MutS, partial [Thermoanaerobaculia bacterium]|nr:DNA mismatch repair protein MutS [Thermoanaerobaculia bacterium]
MPPAAALTPMLRQYLEAKAAHPDALLFYRMGDFYELFYEDAERAAPILEVQLTARHRGSEHEAPMCGVPHHALDGYLGKLLAAGLKVAICDQVENPAQAKGLVRRAVTRVVTPGTLSDPELLESKEENLLAGLTWDGGPADRAAGAGAFLDVSTGRFFVRRWGSAEEAREDLALFRPREVLVEDGALPPAVAEWIERECLCRTDLAEERRFDARRGGELLARQFGVATLRGFGLEEGEPAVRAAAAALAYAQETQQSPLAHVRGLAVSLPADHLVLDATTLANLEVFRAQRGEAAGRRRGTLLGVLDRTVTPPGARALREWLRRPLRDPEAIAARHAAVGELLADHGRRARLREHLARLGDPERLLARAVLGTLAPR